MLTLFFLHGWGFDASVWNGMAARLGGFAHAFCDRGYFGSPRVPTVQGPVLAVAHSFGAMQLLGKVPDDCVGLVAINGFDRFAAHDGFSGVPTRLIDRMIARFDQEPVATLADFRARCGMGEPFGEIDAAPLGEDLASLRHGDRRQEAARIAAPVLSIQGDADPILSPEMRGAVFAGSPRVAWETVAGGGHLLPLTHPEICAAHVARVAQGLA